MTTTDDLSVWTQIRNILGSRDHADWFAGHETMQEAWDACEQGSWMIALLAHRIDPESDQWRALMLASLECAKIAMPADPDASIVDAARAIEQWVEDGCPRPTGLREPYDALSLPDLRGKDDLLDQPYRPRICGSIWGPQSGAGHVYATIYEANLIRSTRLASLVSDICAAATINVSSSDRYAVAEDIQRRCAGIIRKFFPMSPL